MGAEEGPPTLVQPGAAGDGPGLEMPRGPAPGPSQAQEPVSTEPSASLPPHPRHSSARPAARPPHLRTWGSQGEGESTTASVLVDPVERSTGKTLSNVRPQKNQENAHLGLDGADLLPFVCTRSSRRYGHVAVIKVALSDPEPWPCGTSYRFPGWGLRLDVLKKAPSDAHQQPGPRTTSLQADSGSVFLLLPPWPLAHNVRPHPALLLLPVPPLLLQG